MKYTVYRHRESRQEANVPRPFPNSDRHIASPHGVNHSTAHPVGKCIYRMVYQYRCELSKESKHARLWSKVEKLQGSPRSPSGSAFQADTSGCHSTSIEPGTLPPEARGAKQEAHNFHSCWLLIPITDDNKGPGTAGRPASSSCSSAAGGGAWATVHFGQYHFPLGTCGRVGDRQ